jgi:hypothetical protein
MDSLLVYYITCTSPSLSHASLIIEFVQASSPSRSSCPRPSSRCLVAAGSAPSGDTTGKPLVLSDPRYLAPCLPPGHEHYTNRLNHNNKFTRDLL